MSARSPLPLPLLALPSPHLFLFPLAPLRKVRLGSVVSEKAPHARLLVATTLGRRYATEEAPVVIVVAKEARLLGSGPGRDGGDAMVAMVAMVTMVVARAAVVQGV